VGTGHLRWTRPTPPPIKRHQNISTGPGGGRTWPAHVDSPQAGNPINTCNTKTIWCTTHKIHCNNPKAHGQQHIWIRRYGVSCPMRTQPPIKINFFLKPNNDVLKKRRGGVWPPVPSSTICLLLPLHQNDFVDKSAKKLYKHSFHQCVQEDGGTRSGHGKRGRIFFINF